MKELFTITLSMLLSLVSQAENFQGKVHIDTVPQTGFYKIILLPEIISVAKPDYSDIRIYSEKQEEIPYILIEDRDSLYTAIPRPVIKQTDSSSVRKSFIILRFDMPYEISKLELSVKGPDFYLRNCSVRKPVKSNNRSKFDCIDWFQLSSGKMAVWELEKTKTKELAIIIENSDNPPLRIRSVKAFQNTKYLLAKLKSGERYQLSFGNEALKAPDYDLKYFADSISKNAKFIGTSTAKTLTVSKNNSFPLFFNKTFLWVVMSIIMALLTWLSIHLIKDMHTKNK
jgi:hypothetical protein